MTSERSRKDLVLDHCRLLSAGDVEGVMALYAGDVAFEDPVGSGRRTGRDALRAHVEEAVAAHAREVPGAPVAGQDGVHVLTSVTSVMDYLPRGPVYAGRGWLEPPADPEGTRLERYYVLMLRVGPDGLVQELKAFWGRSDLKVVG
ncbi:nuclear transport factor 2 family protein [Actinomadura graeca]|uniref:Nuclear transport factor 2 family protein n=1 Tax=Actinomadura graeca TaxID=2750812 RepID=A0ABX8R9N3_9ACTN|nr:nuclear transport factor 2 family protein [Actinomadura graeca]